MTQIDPKTSDHATLLACYRSGQIPEAAWQEHLKDEGLRAYVEGQEKLRAFAHLHPAMPGSDADLVNLPPTGIGHDVYGRFIPTARAIVYKYEREAEELRDEVRIMALKLSELIATYGDDKVQFQNLDQCAKHIDFHHKTGWAITFGTEVPIGENGPEKLGLVVWLDRARVSEIIAKGIEDV